MSVLSKGHSDSHWLPNPLTDRGGAGASSVKPGLRFGPAFPAGRERLPPGTSALARSWSRRGPPPPLAKTPRIHGLFASPRIYADDPLYCRVLQFSTERGMKWLLLILH